MLERWPTLHVGVEYELGWAPFFVERLDYTYLQRRARRKGWHRFDDPDVIPSDFFRRNVFVAAFNPTRGYWAASHHFWQRHALAGLGSSAHRVRRSGSRSMSIELADVGACAIAVAITHDNTVRLYDFDLGG